MARICIFFPEDLKLELSTPRGQRFEFALDNCLEAYFNPFFLFNGWEDYIFIHMKCAKTGLYDKFDFEFVDGFSLKRLRLFVERSSPEEMTFIYIEKFDNNFKFDKNMWNLDANYMLLNDTTVDYPRILKVIRNEPACSVDFDFRNLQMV